MDQQSFELACANQRQQALENELEKARPKKRTKVKFDANSKFANIKDIVKAKERTKLSAEKE